MATMPGREPLPANGTDPARSVMPARIPSGRGRELGVFGWLFCKLAARLSRIPEFHVFTMLAQHKRLFWSWAPFSGMLLNIGRLPKRDTELVILRVAHLRGCEYELQHHRRIALRNGIDADSQAKALAWPMADGLSARERALLVGVDELIATRTMSDASWRRLAGCLDRRQLIEFVTLVGQYDALAMTLNTVGVPLDFAD